MFRKGWSLGLVEASLAFLIEDERGLENKEHNSKKAFGPDPRPALLFGPEPSQ